MNIRNMRTTDRGTFLAMSDRFYASGAALHSENKQNTAVTFDAFISGNPFLRLLMIELDNQPVGYMMLSFTWSNEVGGLTVLLEELFIEAQCRGLQLGTQAISWLFQEYHHSGRIRLEVMADNDGAIRLYERLGFERLNYDQYVLDANPQA